MPSLLAAAAVAAVVAAAPTELNPRPVVGVLYQPIDATLQPLCTTCTGYLVDSYVRWLQSAGARVALLDWEAPEAELNSSFSQLSGLLLTGGHCSFHNTSYGNVAEGLLQRAVATGDFPVWGTCQGFQQLAQFSSGAMDPSVLHYTGNATEGIALSLNYTDQVPESRLLGSAPASVVTTLGTEAVTLNLHHYSLLANESKLHPSIASFWRVLATNTVEGGPEFVSLMEGRELPFYASQFHGEKNAFEFDQSWESDSRINPDTVHSGPAIAAMGYLVRFFVEETRKSPHRWVNSTPGCRMSYEVAPYYTAAESSYGWENCFLK